jgi:putative membrane protein
MKISKLLTRATLCILVSAGFLSLPANAQKSQKLTDPEIASVAVTANQIDIDYAKIAINKSKNQKVIDFAKTMQKDHGAVIDQAVALVTKLGVTPKDNATSQSLKAQAVKERKALNSKSGKAFDKAYVDNEVAYHTAVINAVENVLIPAASNKELHDLLVSAVPLFKAHLEHAKMLQKSLGK